MKLFALRVSSKEKGLTVSELGTKPPKAPSLGATCPNGGIHMLLHVTIDFGTSEAMQLLSLRKIEIEKIVKDNPAGSGYDTS